MLLFVLHRLPLAPGLGELVWEAFAVHVVVALARRQVVEAPWCEALAYVGCHALDGVMFAVVVDLAL